MTRLFLIFTLLFPAELVCAEVVIAKRNLPPRTIVMASDVDLADGNIDGHANALDQVLGYELTAAVYAARPIPLVLLAAPAIVERNQIVSLVYHSGGITIETEARALERGGVGKRIRAMNLESRITVFGIIAADGRINVGARQ